MAHHIAVVVGVSLALAPWAIKYNQLFPLVKDLVLSIGARDRVTAEICASGRITQLVENRGLAHADLVGNESAMIMLAK